MSLERDNMRMDSNNVYVPYARATIEEEEQEAVNKVLDNPDDLVGGSNSTDLQEHVANLFEKSYGIFVNSGSSANFLAIEALDLPSGSEVITPATTFSTTVSPLVKNNLVPVFVDVDLATYQVDPDEVRSAITDDTSAIFIPSLVGNLPKLDELRTIADEHDIYFVEDSADTIGAKYKGESTGVYSDVSTTSFYGSHIVTGLGGGGMLCVNDPEVRDRALKLRGWGRSSAVDETENIDERLDIDLDGIRYDRKFLFDEVGYNFLGLEASAATCLAQLEKLDSFAARRDQNFQMLYEFFASYDKHFALPHEYDGVNTNWLAFPIRVRKKAPFTRADLVMYLEDNGIQTRSLWSGNILRHPGFSDIDHRVASDNLDHADAIMKSAFVIGCHQSLTDEQIGHVKKTITDFLESK